MLSSSPDSNQMNASSANAPARPAGSRRGRRAPTCEASKSSAKSAKPTSSPHRLSSFGASCATCAAASKRENATRTTAMTARPASATAEARRCAIITPASVAANSSNTTGTPPTVGPAAASDTDMARPSPAARSAVADAVQIVAEIDLLDDVDDKVLEGVGRQAQRFADRAQVSVLGKVDLAVGRVDDGEQLEQPLLHVGGIARECPRGRAAIETLRVELVDAE